MRASLRLLGLIAASVVYLIPAASASAQTCCTTNPPVAPIGPIIQRSQQLITDGGFEDAAAVTPLGSAAWTGWHRYYQTLTPSGIQRPHCTNSPGAMYLAGFSGGGALTLVQDAGYTQQRIAIPAGASNTYLSYWLYFPNQLTEVEQLVVQAVDVAQLPPPFSTQPIPWVTLQTNSNLTTAKNTWVHVTGISMSQFAGATIILKFQARTDQQYPDASQQMPVVTPNGIYIDDVSMWTGLNSVFNLCL